jgi:hypothetical protein
METYTNADDLLRIEKSNRAIEVLGALPASQRKTIIEGLIAAMQLTGADLSEIKKRTVAFNWWDTQDDY